MKPSHGFDEFIDSLIRELNRLSSQVRFSFGVQPELDKQGKPLPPKLDKQGKPQSRVKSVQTGLYLTREQWAEEKRRREIEGKHYRAMERDHLEKDQPDNQMDAETEPPPEPSIWGSFEGDYYDYLEARFNVKKMQSHFKYWLEEPSAPEWWAFEEMVYLYRFPGFPSKVSREEYKWHVTKLKDAWSVAIGKFKKGRTEKDSASIPRGPTGPRKMLVRAYMQKKSDFKDARKVKRLFEVLDDDQIPVPPLKGRPELGRVFRWTKLIERGENSRSYKNRIAVLRRDLHPREKKKKS